MTQKMQIYLFQIAIGKVNYIEMISGTKEKYWKKDCQEMIY